MDENPSSSDEVAAVAPPKPPRKRAPRSTPAKVAVGKTTTARVPKEVVDAAPTHAAPTTEPTSTTELPAETPAPAPASAAGTSEPAADDEPTVPLEISTEEAASWRDTRSVLVRLGLEDHLGRALPPRTEVESAASTDGHGTLDLESAAALTPAEPVPPFEDVVASTRVRSERQGGAARKGRGVRSGFFALLPGGGEAPARHPLATKMRPPTTAQRFIRLARAVRPRPAAERAASSKPRRPVVWRPETLRRWAKAGLVSVIVLGLAAAGVPAAMLSWRSALGVEPSPASVLGGGLALVGLALLAGGLIGLVIAERPAEPSAHQTPPPSFSSLLLGRPGALLAALGVAVLVCAALAAG